MRDALAADGYAKALLTFDTATLWEFYRESSAAAAKGDRGEQLVADVTAAALLDR